MKQNGKIVFLKEDKFNNEIITSNEIYKFEKNPKNNDVVIESNSWEEFIDKNLLNDILEDKHY